LVEPQNEWGVVVLTEDRIFHLLRPIKDEKPNEVTSPGKKAKQHRLWAGPTKVPLHALVVDPEANAIGKSEHPRGPSHKV